MNTHATTTDRTAISQKDTLRGRLTLWLVLIGANICGLAFDSDALGAALRHHPFAYGTHSALSTLGMILGDFVLPVVVVSLAPRRSFLWAAAALCIDLAWSLMDRMVSLNGPGLVSDLADNGAGNLAALLVFCGPISLIRFLVRRSQDHHAQRMREQQDWMRRAAEDQTGVWPPPIQTPE